MSMRVTAGTTLGRYEIIAPLGAGGMGEVYRARDTRLDRIVAVKILPEEFIGNAQLRARFEQEARSISQLNHPNICVLHDVGDNYIVMELLEGETLAERIARGRVPIEEAVRIATDITNALSRAHAAGIVHRDLKPGNVMLTKSGAKLLDFGLAKVLDDDAPPEDNQTVERQLTNAGMVVGTAGYMSPEQVRTEPIDHRSDLFSLGVVLYEMLTGTAPFHRTSSIETMHAIIHDEQPPITGLSPSVEMVIRFALQKDPEERFQNARDFGFALSMIGSSDSHPGLPAKKKAKAKPPIVTVAAEPPLYRRMTFRRGFIMSARFAPDGSVIYGAAWEDHPLEIYSSYQTGPEARPLGLVDADVLSVSSTGELAISMGRRFMGVGYATTGTLARVPLAGGAPRRVAQDIQEAEWTADGKNFLLIRRAEGFYRIESPVGNVIYKTSRWVSRARFSPNEDLIAFIEHPLWGDDAGAVTIIDRKGNVVVRGEDSWNSTSGLAWTPSGKEVWFTGEAIGKGRGRDIMALSLSGKPRVVLPVPGRLTLHDISSDGRVLVAIENGRREAVAGARGQEQQRNLSWFDWSRLCGISADGGFIAFEEQAAGVQGLNTVFIRTTDGSPAVRIGEGRARGNPISPDGEWLAIAVGSPPHLEVVPVGVGEPHIVKCDLLELSGWQFHPDMKRLIVLGNQTGESKQLFDVAIEGDTKPRAISAGVTLTGSFALSRDGSKIAAGTEDRLVIIPVEGGEARPIPGSKPGDVPLEWLKDNDALFVSDRGRASLRVMRLDVNSGERQEWLEIRPDDPAGILDIMPAHITPDGETYAFGYRRLLSDLYIVTGLV
jgi:Tol biopolymer transport system component